ncbi:FAD-dependent oxidoreductase [Actinoplanes derwentensis]|uniref:Glycine cleavage system T protein (Aminomethyltransferase) n=1 Tax=Actinoplanes derwentensis TaxID=113562 RepID=A0A1H2D7F5_9ACTN|nr:FAD-dependent oxidoreductase [Actinoplanes derwentensis]GID89369.1 sarcosine dehydrogenase [Actinoplanes derwentensis]SDT78519.1 Glycine cleavage system T protein (aminomethyltransferase) [Actinoplanes derwentensis]
MTGPAVVIIGAGIVGCALADELTARGWTDVTVLDQGPLFTAGGSTSHTPGLVFRIDASRTMTRLARYTAEKYARLGCFEAVGSLEVAATPERLAELHRRFGFGRSWGVASTVVDPAACVALFPLLDGAAVLGGLHVPDDGLIPAVRAAEIQAARAANAGARFIGNRRVDNVLSNNGRVTGVRTADGETFPAAVVIECTGFWSTGRPLIPMVQQYVRTTPAGAADSLPILRHPDRDLYFRAHGDRIGIGSYRLVPGPDDLDDLPGDGRPAMLPFTRDGFRSSWTAATELIPALRGTAIDDAFNGVLAMTADGFPLLGEVEPRGLWTAAAVSVAHSAGAAKALAEWIIDGAPGIDLRELDADRFGAAQRVPAYVKRNVIAASAIAHPHAPPALRDLRIGAFHSRQVELGAVFGAAGGWERPLWYTSNPPPDDAPPRDEWSSRHGSPIAGTEARLTRRKVALFDLTAADRAELLGPMPGPPVGQLIRSGGMTLARVAEHRTLMVGGALPRQLPPGVTVRDITGGTCGLGVWGPVARELVTPLTGPVAVDVWEGVLGLVPVTMLRIPLLGEPGWEIYTEAGYGARLWDTLWAAGRELGLVVAGQLALDSLRLEAGRRADPPAGDRSDPDRCLVCLVVTESGDVPVGGEAVYAGGFAVGHVTEAAYGWTVGAPIAYAWLPAALSSPGTQVEIGYFDRMLTATVSAEPLFRPENEGTRITR